MGDCQKYPDRVRFRACAGTWDQNMVYRRRLGEYLATRLGDGSVVEITASDVYRWALAVGMAQIERELDEQIEEDRDDIRNQAP